VPEIGDIDDATRLQAAAVRLPAHEPIPRLPHLDDPRFSTRRIGDSDDRIHDIFVFRDVLAELRYRATFAPDDASACLLTGGYYVGPQGPYVEIDGFRDAVGIESPLALMNHLRAHPGLIEEDARRGVAFDDRDIVVGICEIRPESEGHLEPADFMLFNTFFPRPYQIALIIDPAKNALGFYAREPAGRIVNAPFFVIALGPSDDSDGDS